MDAVREPRVAGRFYPADPSRLREAVLAHLSAAPSGSPRTHKALIAPHAGYIYSGQVAGCAFAQTTVPERVIVLCPNHTGHGSRRSCWGDGRWRIPGAAVEVAAELAREVIERAGLEFDYAAHRLEHAIEVELPFLHARRADVTIVPICLGHLTYAECEQIGEGVAAAVGNEDVLLVASTDMSHYVSVETARDQDALALDRIEQLDAKGLYDVVHQEDISMCGVIPTTVALVAARALGGKSATLAAYSHSGEASGDHDRVVGYASLLVA
jgi:hypothetical protein